MTHRTRRFDQYHREFLVINLNRRWDQYSSIRSEKKRLQPGETVLRRRWLSRTSFPNRLATLRRSKVRQILKNFGSTSINVYRERAESGAESFQSCASVNIDSKSNQKCCYAESARIRIESIDDFNSPRAGSGDQRDHGTRCSSSICHGGTRRCISPPAITAASRDCTKRKRRTETSAFLTFRLIKMVRSSSNNQL